MLFFSLATLSLALSAIAAPLGSDEPKQDLVIELTVKNSKVSSLDQVELTATVTNNGEEEVRILKFGTVLDDLPTRSFAVTKGGKDVPFKGIHIQVDLDETTEESYAVIPSGKTFTTTHKVGDIYDFESAGAGAFAFASLTDFPIAKHFEDKNIATSLASAHAVGSSVEIEITDVKHHQPQKRAVLSCQNQWQAAFIRASYFEAKELARLASKFVREYATSTLYKAYWKSARPSTVADVYDVANAEGSKVRKLSCHDEINHCKGGIIAYAFVAPPQDIVFCPIFFNEVSTHRLCSGTAVSARKIRGGTALHELTHAVGNTDDVTYGCEADQALSFTDQVRNADNYNCFATQVYKDIYCPV